MNKKAEIDMIDILLYASAPYTGKNEIEAYNAADPEIRLTEKAKKRIQKRLRREQEYKERHERYSPIWEISKRVAIVVLVVLSISFISVMSIEAVRVALWEAILEWSEEWIHVRFVNTAETPELLNEILIYREPRNIGEEFVRYDGLKDEYCYSIEYESDTHIIAYVQDLIKNNSIYTSNEDTVVENIMVHDSPGIMTEFESYGITMIRIIWNDGEYSYTLSSNLSYNELLEIAESVS